MNYLNLLHPGKPDSIQLIQLHKSQPYSNHYLLPNKLPRSKRTIRSPYQPPVRQALLIKEQEALWTGSSVDYFLNPSILYDLADICGIISRTRFKCNLYILSTGIFCSQTSHFLNKNSFQMKISFSKTDDIPVSVIQIKKILNQIND